MTNNTIPPADRIIREAERLHLTSISRSQAYQLEKIGRFPQRIRLGNRSVGWRLSSINAFIKSPMLNSTNIEA